MWTPFVEFDNWELNLAVAPMQDYIPKITSQIVSQIV
jgi:hypothetical protein